MKNTILLLATAITILAIDTVRANDGTDAGAPDLKCPSCCPQDIAPEGDPEPDGDLVSTGEAAPDIEGDQQCGVDEDGNAKYEHCIQHYVKTEQPMKQKYTAYCNAEGVDSPPSDCNNSKVFSVKSESEPGDPAKSGAASCGPCLTGHSNVG